MPLQNRATPFGTIEALPGRGTIMGNRGVLCNDRREIVRPWQVRRWITCVLEWRGVRRTVMEANRWTELFFLDEAAAFAAGHRPCAYCRRDDYNRFKAIWESVYGSPARADDMDLVLHATRVDGRTKRTFRADMRALPNGTFVRIHDAAWLLREDALHAWSDAGYREKRVRSAGTVEVLTPEPLVEIFKAGYVPAVHVSAR